VITKTFTPLDAPLDKNYQLPEMIDLDCGLKEKDE